MAIDKLRLYYKPEDEDYQQIARRKSLCGFLEYRKKSSITDLNFRTELDKDRIDYVTRDFLHTVGEIHDFAVSAEKDTIWLSRDQFFLEKIGDHRWNIVLTTPKKAIDVHGISQRTGFFAKKISEENYAYLIPEIESLRHLDAEFALRLADTIEEAMNISKLEADDIFQKRVIEDLQWNMIDIKKTISDIVYNVNVEKGEKKLMNKINGLVKKLSALEDIRRASGELGIDEKEALKGFAIKNLPSGRVELVWKKSG